MSGEIFWAKIFVWKEYTLLIIFGLWAKNFSAFWRKIFGRVVKTASTCPEEHFKVFEKNSKRERTSVENVNTIGRYPVKKRTALNGWFSSHIINMAENKKQTACNLQPAVFAEIKLRAVTSSNIAGMFPSSIDSNNLNSHKWFWFSKSQYTHSLKVIFGFLLVLKTPISVGKGRWQHTRGHLMKNVPR